jgi:hypothetical protein
MKPLSVIWVWNSYPFDSTILGDIIMGRPTNPLLQFLLNDEEAKKKFIELISECGTIRGLWDYLQLNTFYGQNYSYLRGQTLLNIVKRLGFKGRKGRPGTSSVLQSIPRFIEK